jgi:hypothetical protein
MAVNRVRHMTMRQDEPARSLTRVADRLSRCRGCVDPPARGRRSRRYLLSRVGLRELPTACDRRPLFAPAHRTGIPRLGADDMPRAGVRNDR